MTEKTTDIAPRQQRGIGRRETGYSSPFRMFNGRDVVGNSHRLIRDLGSGVCKVSRAGRVPHRRCRSVGDDR